MYFTTGLVDKKRTLRSVYGWLLASVVLLLTSVNSSAEVVVTTTTVTTVTTVCKGVECNTEKFDLREGIPALPPRVKAEPKRKPAITLEQAIAKKLAARPASYMEGYAVECLTCTFTPTNEDWDRVDPK